MRFRLLGVMVCVAVLGQCGFGLAPSRSLEQYGRQVWGTDNGLPQNTVHAVAQGRDGYVWLGTDDGLVRFDGSEFKVYTTENAPELRSNSVQGLTVDRQGRLWVVTAGGLAVYGARRFRGMGVADGLPDATVWFVHEDRRGRIWVATAGGLCIVRGVRCEGVAATKGMSVGREERFAEAGDGATDGGVWLADGPDAVRLDGSSLARVAALKTVGGAEILTEMVAGDGSLLVGTAEGLEVSRKGVLVPVAIAGATGRVSVNAMAQAGDGEVWLGTSAGLAKGSGSGFEMVRAAGASAAVQLLFADRQGAVWVGTANGVARVVGGRVEVFRAGDALAGSSLLSAMEDREGNVWLGTESDGLTVLHEQKFTTYTTAEGLSGNVVRSVLQGSGGGVWVGTDGAGLNRRTADGFQSMTVREGLSSNVILALASGANGDLWVGTPTGLNRVRGREVKVLTTADGLADDFIRSLQVDAKGNVWVGTRHGLTRIAPGNDGLGGMTTYTAMDGLGSDFIGVMVQARDGDLWIGTSGGLTRLHDGRFTNFRVRDGLAKNVVTAILEDGDGTLWLGSNGGGLSRMKDGVIVPVTATNLPEAISSVLEDGEKRLWIGSRGGVFRVAESELDRSIAQGGGVVAVSAYDTTDGMRVRECSSGGHPAAVRMRDGTLWFATLRGVSVVDPEHLHENRVAPMVGIETVLVNDVARDGSGELVLGPGRQRVEFQYAGLSFVAPQKVRYRYRLEGFDREWVDAGAHRSAFYSNLQPGRYVFHVEAANNDGVWSETDAVMRLRVKPYFWQTWWFYVLLLVVVAGLAYLLYVRRVRRVEARYAGVMEERSRIAREIHDTLAQGIVSISLQLEVVTRLMGSSVEAARAQLDETRVLVRQSLADARSSIWDLRAAPGEGEAEELPVRVGRSLKMLTGASNAAGSSSVTGRMTVTGSYRAIARPVEDELLRIAQEAVTNAVRHSGCSSIEVTLSYDLKGVRLVVRDDGRGFDAAAAGPAGHFGLRGMRERAAKIHARLEVWSEVGKGTEIRVALTLG